MMDIQNEEEHSLFSICIKPSFIICLDEMVLKVKAPGLKTSGKSETKQAMK